MRLFTAAALTVLILSLAALFGHFAKELARHIPNPTTALYYLVYGQSMESASLLVAEPPTVVTQRPEPGPRMGANASRLA